MPVAAPTWDETSPVEAPSWADTSPVAPAWSETAAVEDDGLPADMPASQRKQLALASEMAAVQKEQGKVEREIEGIDVLQGGIIPPHTFEAAIAVGGGPINELPGVRSSVAEAASGMTSPVNLALLAAGGAGAAIPKIGGAIARGVAGGFGVDIARHMPELGTAAGEASVTGTPEEQQKAFADIGISAVMGGAALRGAAARMPKPEPPVIRLAQENHLPATAEALRQLETDQPVTQLETPIVGTKATATSDLAAYNEVQAKMGELLKQGKAVGDPEFDALFAQNEAIKNRNGGMPPKEPTQGAPNENTSTENSRADVQNAASENVSGVPLAERSASEKAPVSEGELVGMGGAVPGEFRNDPRTPTSIKNETVAEERIKRGFPAAVQAARRGFQSVWDGVMERIDREPHWQDNLIAELKKDSRALKDSEDAALLHRQIDLQNEMGRLNREINRAFEDGDGGGLDAAKAQRDIISDKLQELYDINKSAGTETGRGLNARKMMAFEDFSLAQLEQSARAARGGRRLTPEELTEVDRVSKKATELEQQLAEREKTLSETESKNSALEELLKMQKEQSKHPEAIIKMADRIVATLDKRADAARARLREKFARTSAGVDPTILKDLAEIGASHIARGVKTAAEFSVKMIEDFGEAVRPWLDKAWEKANAEFDRVETQIAGPMKEGVKKARAAKKQSEDTIKDAKESLAQEDLQPSEISAVARKLAKHFIETGVTEREGVIDAVHGVLKEAFPEMTRREAMDAISRYGQFSLLSKEAAAVRLREISGEAQQLSKIEDIKGGKPPLKTGQERQAPTDEQRRLIKVVNELKKEFGIVTTDPATQLKSAQAAIETRLSNAIKDITHELETGKKNVESRKPAPTNEKIEKLRERLSGLRQLRDEMFGPESNKELRLRHLQRMMEHYQERIDKGDFSKKAKKFDLSRDPDYVSKKAELETIKNEYRRQEHAEQLKQRTIGKKIWDGIRRTRGAFVNIASSFDFSAPRQALVAILANTTRLVTNPKVGARMLGRPFADMFKAWANERVSKQLEQKIKLRQNAQSGADGIAKIEYSELDSNRFSKFEENAHSVLDEWAALPLRTGNSVKSAATAIPKLAARGIRMSNRAFITFLNSTRAELFDELLRSNFKDRAPTVEELKAVGNLVNVATGRGKLSPMTARVASEFLWAPKLLASRIQFMAGQPLYGGTLKTRAIVAKEYARAIIGGYLLWNVSRLFDDKKEESPTSSDFGKIVRGDTRIDLWGGFQQVTTLGSRVATASTKTLKGKEHDIGAGKKYGQRSPWYYIVDFGRSKARPDVGVAIDIMDRVTYGSEATRPEGVAKSLLVPLPMRDIVQIMEAHGFTEGMIMEALGQFGAGVSHYEERERQR